MTFIGICHWVSLLGWGTQSIKYPEWSGKRFWWLIANYFWGVIKHLSIQTSRCFKMIFNNKKNAALGPCDLYFDYYWTKKCVSLSHTHVYESKHRLHKWMILKNNSAECPKVWAEGTGAKQHIKRVHLLSKLFNQQSKVCQWEATNCRLEEPDRPHIATLRRFRVAQLFKKKKKKNFSFSSSLATHTGP